MKVMTPAMADALTARGFTRTKRRWVRLHSGVPTEVYEEKAQHGPHYGIGVLFGWPDTRRNVSDEFSCLQVSQRASAGEPHGHFYDFADPGERAQCERDFFAATIPLLDDFITPDDLVNGLFEHRITPAHDHDPADVPLAAMDVINAWSLDHLRPRLWEEMRRAAQDRTTYERLVMLADRWPEFRPGLAEFIESVPVPPASIRHRLRMTAQRVAVAVRRRRARRLLRRPIDG